MDKNSIVVDKTVIIRSCLFKIEELHLRFSNGGEVRRKELLAYPEFHKARSIAALFIGVCPGHEY